MFRKTMMAAAAVCAIAAAPAYAQVALTATPGSSPYAGPAPTYDFEGGGPTGGAPITGGLVLNSSNSGDNAQPYGSAGHYWSIGTSNNGSQPGILDLSSFAAIGAISFIWGSVDSYNTLEVLDRVGGVLATFTGSNAAVNPNGDQSNPVTNPLARITIGGADQYNVGGLRLTSGQNAFEVDNFAVTAVPEPAIWAMLLIGFGFIGAFMRGAKRQRRLRLKLV
jgi:PEP-CTERM motif-containing protein